MEAACEWKQSDDARSVFNVGQQNATLPHEGPFPQSQDAEINGFTHGLISLPSILIHSRLAPAEPLLLYWWIMSHAWGLFGSGLSGQRTIGLKWSVWKNMWHMCFLTLFRLFGSCTLFSCRFLTLHFLSKVAAYVFFFQTFQNNI